jgi:hypothetical protein
LIQNQKPPSRRIFDQAALAAVLRHRVQRRIRLPETRLVWRFKNCRCFEAMFEWLRLVERREPRPHFSQIRAILLSVFSLIVG